MSAMALPRMPRAGDGGSLAGVATTGSPGSRRECSRDHVFTCTLLAVFVVVGIVWYPATAAAQGHQTSGRVPAVLPVSAPVSSWPLADHGVGDLAVDQVYTTTTSFHLTCASPGPTVVPCRGASQRSHRPAFPRPTSAPHGGSCAAAGLVLMGGGLVVGVVGLTYSSTDESKSSTMVLGGLVLMGIGVGVAYAC